MIEHRSTPMRPETIGRSAFRIWPNILPDQAAAFSQTLTFIVDITRGNVYARPMINKLTRTKVYQIEGMDDVVGEFETDEELRVLDDLQEARFFANYHEALLVNDRAALDRMVSDHAFYVAERFGKGEVQTKEEFLDTFGKKAVVSVASHAHTNVRLRAFGDNMVLKTGVSHTEISNYKGRPSHPPRLFAISYMKLDGRWQVVVHSIMDFNGEYV